MEKVKQIQVGSQTVGGDGKLFVMAGPCVIEDPERTLAIGKAMKAICEKLGLTYIFKASFDKANRSSYTSYRGPGLTEGLRILADIKKELQVPVVSDIHETCQAEAAAHLRQSKALQLARTPLAELWRHPLHTREMGSQITNVMRCLYLESQGYRVTVTELVGWEHSLKNELILASYNGQKKRSAAQRMQALAESFGLESWLQQRFPRLLLAA